MTQGRDPLRKDRDHYSHGDTEKCVAPAARGGEVGAATFDGQDSMYISLQLSFPPLRAKMNRRKRRLGVQSGGSAKGAQLRIRKPASIVFFLLPSSESVFAK